MRCENLDVHGEKPVHNDAGELCLYGRAKQAVWKEHYECLSNVEFDWDPDSLTEVYLEEGPAPHILLDLVIKAIQLIKCGKAVGTSQIIAEMLEAARVEGAQQIHNLIEDIISLCKGKGVALEQGNNRGLTLLDQVMEVLQRVYESFLWHQVRIDDMQFVFMPGRSTTDAIFVVRQLQEKFYAINKTLYMAFVDLEKAFDCVPQACHLVSSLQAQCWGVTGAAHTEHVRKHQKQSACWLQPAWRVQCESGRSPRLLPEPLTVNHSSGSPLPHRMPLGKPVCRWPGHHH